MMQLDSPIEEVANLPEDALSNLLRASEAALNIRNRSDLFLWSQGSLQALLPHDLMIGMTLDKHRQVQHLEALYSVVLKPNVIEGLTEKYATTLAKALGFCANDPKGYWALESRTDIAESNESHDLLSCFAELGFSSGVFQDSGPFGDSSRSFFVFLGSQKPPPYASLLLQFLMPHLHLAISRCGGPNASGQKLKSESRSHPSVPSERQFEILEWVKSGKTNFEISIILGISELTVKNHLQNLFKKLNVHNRAQAVAKVFSRT